MSWWRITNADLVELAVDVLVPAALEGVLTKPNAHRVRARFVVGGANGPTTPAEDVILEAAGVVVVPDILANAGGVVVSYFEWVQNLASYAWDEAEVDARLQLHMDRAFAEVVAMADARGTSLRTAAQVIAVDRVAEAHRVRGLYP